MNFFWNLDEGKITTGERSSVAKSAFEFKRRDGVAVEVVFVRGSGIIQEMPSTTEIRFALKKKGDYAGGNVAFSADFVEGADHIWRANPNLNTTQINEAFEDGEGEFASIELMGELTMRADAGEPWISTQTLTVTIHNDVIRGDEGTPNDADEPTSYLTAAQIAARIVRYDVAQSLTSGQKTQARTNIGVIDNPKILYAQGDVSLTPIGGAEAETVCELALTAGTWLIEVHAAVLIALDDNDGLFELQLRLASNSNVTSWKGVLHTIGGGVSDHNQTSSPFGGTQRTITTFDGLRYQGRLVLTGAQTVRVISAETAGLGTGDASNVWASLMAREVIS